MQILNRNSYNIHPWHAISKEVPKTYNSGLRIKTIIKKQVYQKKNKGCHPNPKSTQFQVRISIELQKEEEEDYSYFRNTEIPIHQIQLEKKKLKKGAKINPIIPTRNQSRKKKYKDSTKG